MNLYEDQQDRARTGQELIGQFRITGGRSAKDPLGATQKEVTIAARRPNAGGLGVTVWDVN
jgi:hypothetical protein